MKTILIVTLAFLVAVTDAWADTYSTFKSTCGLVVPMVVMLNWPATLKQQQ
jgi:hypothetical protein